MTYLCMTNDKSLFIAKVSLKKEKPLILDKEEVGVFIEKILYNINFYEKDVATYTVVNNKHIYKSHKSVIRFILKE